MTPIDDRSLRQDDNTDHEHEELEHIWGSPGGFIGWFSDLSHQAIGRRYVVTALIFLFLGGLEALLMRIQLMRPENNFLTPDQYNQIFTVHGSTMMFLFAVPVMQGIGVYLVPLMLGTRDLAFPRLNAYGYYIYVFGGILLYVALFANTGPDAGWFAYTPLSGPDYSPGKRVDIWAQMITFTELSALTTAVALIVTIMRLKAPGMSMNRLPLFCWSMLVQSVMILFAMPAVMVGSGMLILDRTIGTHFFNPAEGGDPLLWQHLFWFFGHPEVYIIFIPALGILSHLIATFTRTEIFGYTAMVLSLIATGFIGFGLWVHHMFAAGLPQLGESFFTAASLMIVIPNGTQIFCWLATMWQRRPRMEIPMWYVLGFFFIFVMGGLTGVMLACVPFDTQVHDTFFVVAHFHYVLIGGAVFPLLGGIVYWYPKVTGRFLNQTVSKITFWLLFFGFNLTFFPMHYLGFMGMPRRVYTYRPETGWGDLNLLITFAAGLLAVGGVLFLGNMILSARKPPHADENPYDAPSFEWATGSPPPSYNFLRPPVCRGRYPLWISNELPVITGVRTNDLEVLVTTVLDAKPDHRYIMPGPSVYPFLLAVTSSVGFVGTIFNMWWGVYAAALSVVPLVLWFWPRPGVTDLLHQEVH